MNSYSYLPFGQILTSSQSVSNPFQFGGQLGVLTVGGGLDLMRARFFSPQDGRFITRDPAGVAGGSNLYTFAANDPLNLDDPTGLDPIFDDVAASVGFVSVYFIGFGAQAAAQGAVVAAFEGTAVAAEVAATAATAAIGGGLLAAFGIGLAFGQYAVVPVVDAGVDCAHPHRVVPEPRLGAADKTACSTDQARPPCANDQCVYIS